MRITAIFIVLLLVGACSGTDFAGGTKKDDGATDKDSKDDAGDEGDTDSDSDSDKADGGDVDSDSENDDDDDDIIFGDEETSTPRKCTAANISFVPGTSATCPANFAAYTADDADNPVLACCALPSKNILLKDPAQARQTCLTDEIATGVQGNSLLCTKINTAKYKLNSPSITCYVGSGSSGGSGAGACGVPPETLTAMVAKFGSDACIGQPFGALIVGWTGDNCGDVSSAQLLDAKTNQPIVMFAP